VAIGVLAVLPVVIFTLPALAGLPVTPGDDHTQNFPLRVLAGELWRHGHLPLLNPYIWSGAPLLGGWNAAAAYPLTFLFAVLPGLVAWTANLMITWWAAGFGTYAFLRASRLSPVASFLGALTFAFAGAMPAQVPHFGLVSGLSWIPFALLATLRLSERSGLRPRLLWTSVLAAAIALVILAGEPRALDDAVIIVAVYALWRAWRLRRWPDGLGYLGLVLAGAALGVAIGAVQWLPGIEAIYTSQRAHGEALFNAGSLARKRLLLSLVPNLMGGSGSFGQPAFLGTYSLTEMTGYVGLMPLAAAGALLARRRWRPLPEWLVWHVTALIGVLLALGGNTPLGHLLVHLPFFGDQRLQSRNLVIADFALAVLLAYWADDWLGERRRSGSLARRLLAAAPGAAAVAVIAAMMVWGAGMLRWLGLAADRAAHASTLRLELVPFALLGALAVAVAWWGPRLGRAGQVRVLTWFVSVDITLFTLLSVVAVAPTPGDPAAPPAAPAAAPATPPPGSTASTTALPHQPAAPAVPVARFTHGGRFAIYDPDLLGGGELTALGVPDGNVMTQTPSIEGYSSIVDGTYATATGSHQASGDGQNVLAPSAIGDGTLDQLGTTVLLTPSAYLITPVTGAAAAGPGLRHATPAEPATWYFGAWLPVTGLTLPASGARGLKVGLVEPSGRVDWVSASAGPGASGAAAGPAGGGGTVRVTLPQPHEAVAVRVATASGSAVLGPPVLSTAGGGSYRAAGPLQDALVPPRWRFSGFDGSFAMFADSMARPALTLQALPGVPAAGARIHPVAGPQFAPSAARVSSPHGVTVIRSVAAIPGWTAAWRPAGQAVAKTLPLRRSGLVQAVTVPPGRGTLTWAYDPPGARLGGWLSLAGLAVLLGVGVTAASAGRRRSGKMGSA
jgi:hypothetical protein